MKRRILILITALCLPALAFSAQYVKITIKGQQAKNIYNQLTGPLVQSEGAMGHAYRNGKKIICRYTQADMDDSHGHPVPQYDIRRYACMIHFDRNGYALPG